MAGLFWLVGPHIPVGRLLMSVLLVVATLLVHRLVRRLTGPLRAAGTTLLFEVWQALY